MTAVTLSAATAAAFTGGCGETPVDPKQQEMNQVAQKAANKVVGQMVAFAESDEAKTEAGSGWGEPAVDVYDKGPGGTIQLSNLIRGEVAAFLDCEGETRYSVAEVNYDDQDPAQVSTLNVYSEVSYQYGNCQKEDSYATSRNFTRDQDGNWEVTVSRFDTLDSDRSLSDSTYKQAETVGAVRKIAADAQKDIDRLLADEPR